MSQRMTSVCYASLHESDVYKNKSIEQLENELKVAKAKLLASEQSNARMFKTIGGDVVQRDAPRMTYVTNTDDTPPFPNGTELREKYEEFTRSLNVLYPIIDTAIGTLKTYKNCAEAYTLQQYLKDIYNTCSTQVYRCLHEKKMKLMLFTDKSKTIPIPLDESGGIVKIERTQGMVNDVWYFYMQQQAMVNVDAFLAGAESKNGKHTVNDSNNDEETKEVNPTDENRLSASDQYSYMVRTCPPHILELHNHMLQLHEKGKIEYSGINILTLVDKLAKLLVYAALSDPPCYLYPKPGEEIPFSSKMCEGVHLSPSTDPMMDGDRCIVLFPGLFYEYPTSATDVSHESVDPLIKAHVTRLDNTAHPDPEIEVTEDDVNCAKSDNIPDTTVSTLPTAHRSSPASDEVHSTSVMCSFINSCNIS